MQNHLFATAFILIACSAAVAAERRELGAHEHGHGTLNIAIEGPSLAIELEAPGADIAGFEHKAETKKDKETQEKAMSTLKEPLMLFNLPGAAGCDATDSKVELEHEEHEDHDKHAKHDADTHAKHDDDHKKDAKHDDHDDVKSAEHTAFHAEYKFNCKTPAELRTVTFSYFKVFPNAQSLTIEVITPKGQSKFEATRDKPTIDLSGLM